MSERYYIDERVGCIAVRDRTQKSDRPHLDSETIGVVKYWQGGSVSDICPTCGHHTSHWEVPEETRHEAQKLCGTLNKNDVSLGEYI